MSNILIQQLDHGITRLCLNRAPVNAMTPAFLKEIEVALKELEKDETVTAVIIASDLAVLSAGVDLKEAVNFTVEEQVALCDGLNDTFLQQYGMDKPVITEASGPAIAGGFFFVVTADYTVAKKGVSFALAEVKVGVAFPTGPLELARHALTAPALRRMMLTGDFIGTTQALAMGVIDEEIDGDLDAVKDAAFKAAKRYAKLPPKTFATIKQQMRGDVLELIKRGVASKKDGFEKGWFNDETVDAMNAMIAATAKK